MNDPTVAPESLPPARLGDDAEQRREHLRRTRRLLNEAASHVTRRFLHLVGFLLFAYLILKLIPGFRDALSSLQNVSLGWIVVAMAVETVSESGYAVSWRRILDPDNLLMREGRGRHLAARVAWAQLGGGMVVPGGTIGSMGVGAWMLHRLGMSMDRVAERQFVLMFLNTGVDAIAIVVFGLGLGLGLFPGTTNPALTWLPAGVVAVGLVLIVIIAQRAEQLAARVHDRRPKLATGIGTLAKAVAGVRGILTNRGSLKTVLGACAYLGFDMFVLWGAFHGIHAHPVPSYAVVAMCYLIGGLFGSIPLPANLGAVTGMAGALIVYGVDKTDALAAVVLYQAIGYIVPLIGGGIAYLLLRREMGGMSREAVAAGDPPTAEQLLRP
jgi:uncharacterized membrane protein YbhN (UPF0104 family)